MSGKPSLAVRRAALGFPERSAEERRRDLDDALRDWASGFADRVAAMERLLAGAADDEIPTPRAIEDDE